MCGERQEKVISRRRVDEISLFDDNFSTVDAGLPEQENESGDDVEEDEMELEYANAVSTYTGKRVHAWERRVYLERETRQNGTRVGLTVARVTPHCQITELCRNVPDAFTMVPVHGIIDESNICNLSRELTLFTSASHATIRAVWRNDI